MKKIKDLSLSLGLSVDQVFADTVGKRIQQIIDAITTEDTGLIVWVKPGHIAVSIGDWSPVGFKILEPALTEMYPNMKIEVDTEWSPAKDPEAEGWIQAKIDK